MAANIDIEPDAFARLVFHVGCLELKIKDLSCLVSKPTTMQSPGVQDPEMVVARPASFPRLKQLREQGRNELQVFTAKAKQNIRADATAA